MNLDFFLLQTAQFDKSINLFCLVFMNLSFHLQYFSYNWHNMFLLFLYVIFHITFKISDFSFHFIIFLLHIIYFYKSILINISIDIRFYKSKLRLYLIWFLLTLGWWWLATWATPFWRHNLGHFGLITNLKRKKLKIMQNVQNWLPPGFQIYDVIKNVFSGSGSRSKIRRIAQG